MKLVWSFVILAIFSLNFYHTTLIIQFFPIKFIFLWTFKDVFFFDIPRLDLMVLYSLIFRYTVVIHSQNKITTIKIHVPPSANTYIFSMLNWYIYRHLLTNSTHSNHSDLNMILKCIGHLSVKLTFCHPANILKILIPMVLQIKKKT